MESFDYFKVCKDCNTFCCQKFNAFLAKNEIQRIRNKLKELDLKFKDNKANFFEFKSKNFKNQTIKIRFLKKINGKCLFLKNNKICLIHEVKPFDCKLWPLTFDYFVEENTLIIYLGMCPLTNELPNSWIESTIQKIEEELKKWDKNELLSYSLMSDLENYKIIKKIPNFL